MASLSAGQASLASPGSGMLSSGARALSASSAASIAPLACCLASSERAELGLEAKAASRADLAVSLMSSGPVGVALEDNVVSSAARAWYLASSLAAGLGCRSMATASTLCASICSRAPGSSGSAIRADSNVALAISLPVSERAEGGREAKTSSRTAFASCLACSAAKNSSRAARACSRCFSSPGRDGGASVSDVDCDASAAMTLPSAVDAQSATCLTFEDGMALRSASSSS
mmetsp:Transcript_68833/g.195024  ORF Transcript_68833/g.195024 Transcript_68833/m.195024 type:complete len:231 (+) Transcript_68833:1193-1885(+)